MKVFVYVKHKIHPEPQSAGMQRGDICDVQPVSDILKIGRKALNTYAIVVMDLNIPCGQGEVDGMDFIVTTKKEWICNKCPFNDVVSCDARKYMSAIWSTGDILNAPNILKKRIHNVDYSKFISSESIGLVEKQNKTEVEKASVFTDANKIKNVQLKSTVKEEV